MRIKDLKAKVLYCLEKYPETRNSDIKLTNAIWLKYYSEKIFYNSDNDFCVKLTDLYNLPREDNVKRCRAKIQNEEGQYLPTTLEVVKKRRINEEAWRTAMGYTKFEEIIT